MVFQIIKPLIYILFLSVVFFSFIYYILEYRDFTDCFFVSVMIQTLVGVPETPVRDTTKWVMNIQALLSYVLSAGIILVVIQRHHAITSHSRS